MRGLWRHVAHETLINRLDEGRSLAIHEREQRHFGALLRRLCDLRAAFEVRNVKLWSGSLSFIRCLRAIPVSVLLVQISTHLVSFAKLTFLAVHLVIELERSVFPARAFGLED